MRVACDVLIVGGGTGGVAAALAACEGGARVVMTEPTDWVGGQLTAQAVPPDENQWIESFGSTRRYRAFREGVRDGYRRRGALTPDAASSATLNPGGGWVSRLCHEPAVGERVLRGMLAPHEASGRLTLLGETDLLSADVEGDVVRGTAFLRRSDGARVEIDARYVLDATELGDVYEAARVEHMIGGEGSAAFGELHGRADAGDPRDQQAISWCFAVEHRPGEDHRGPRPAAYDRWRSFVPAMAPGEAPWPGPLFSWTVPSHNQEGRRTFPFIPWPDGCPPGVWDMWRYRRIVDRSIYQPGREPAEVCLVNWVQMDYWDKPLLGVSAAERETALQEARGLSECLLYWLQTDAPRHDGDGHGYPGLRPHGASVGTADGFAKAAYIREPRRLVARRIVTEGDIGTEQRRLEGRDRTARAAAGHEVPAMGLAEPFADSVGVGHYLLDLHPSVSGRNSVYVPASPFRIPLGALIPVRVRNVIAAGKGIGVTHITNGCYRMHAVEWNVGESAGALAAHCLARGLEPAQVWESAERTREFQALLSRDGVPLAWPWEA
ncbi:MAG: FAD-dependent oxidoreductase [Phycisphaeraceae bacterium]|nr:MAG: FAD-dependent oxidoreductase [Phycisphaeraceae bacterium]